MASGPDDVEDLQEAAGEAVSRYWRLALEKACEEAGDQVAATGMFIVSLEALRDGMGNEATADLLEAMAAGVRSGEDVTLTIDLDRGTEH